MVTVAVLLALPSWADAKPRIALTPIDGDTSGAVGDAVLDAVDGDALTVISQRLVNKAVDKLGLDADMSEKQARKLSTELEADAVVIGKLDKAGPNKVLHFRLYVHGKKARGFKVTFNNAKSERFKAKLRDKLVSKIAGETAAPPPDEEPAEPAVGKTKGKGGGDDEEDPIGKKPKTTAKAKDGEAGEAGDEEGDEEAKPTKKPAKKPKKKKPAHDEGEDGGDEEAGEELAPKVSAHAANRVAARLDVGVSAQNRSLIFNSRANFPEAPKPYRNSVVPGARFEAELYPLAFGNPRSLAAGLGFAAEYDKTLSLTLTSSAEPTVPVKANQNHWSVGVRMRFVLGSRPVSPSITLGVGYGKRTFTTDRSGLMMDSSLDVPDTKYTMFDPGIAFRFPLARPVALLLAGRGMVITNAGPIQDGTSYGRARVYGATAQAGLDIVLGSRFAIRLVGEFTQVGFAFTGTGELAKNRDQDPDTKDVGGAADRSVGGTASLAVLY